MNNYQKYKNLIKKINIILYFIVIFVILMLIMSRYSIFGLKLFVIRSGSMSPALKVGSVVLVRSASDYRQGEIITFYKPGDMENTVTHRLNKVIEGTPKMYETKGDANDAPDSDLLLTDKIVGRVIFNIPFLGYIVVFEKSLAGLILLVFLPIAVIIFDEITNIRLELQKISERKKRSDKIRYG